MLDRAKQLRILVESARKSLEQVDWALEALETGSAQKSNYSSMQRGFHTIKHDAAHVGLERLAKLCGAAEAIVERAADRKLGLPLDLLRAASKELRAAIETIAAGGRHKLDERLLTRLEDAAAQAPVE